MTGSEVKSDCTISQGLKFITVTIANRASDLIYVGGANIRICMHRGNAFINIFQDVKLQAAEQESHRALHTVRQYVIHNDVEDNKEDIERDG